VSPQREREKSVCVCVGVCVRERERERERARVFVRETHSERDRYIHPAHRLANLPTHRDFVRKREPERER